ncbi:hypothetical protein D3C80_1148870 [compost metagenome]
MLVEIAAQPRCQPALPFAAAGEPGQIAPVQILAGGQTGGHHGLAIPLQGLLRLTGGEALAGGVTPEQRALLGGGLGRYRGGIALEDGLRRRLLPQGLIEIGDPAVVVEAIGRLGADRPAGQPAPHLFPVAPCQRQLGHAEAGIQLPRRVRQHPLIVLLGLGPVATLTSPAGQHQADVVVRQQGLQQALGAVLVALLAQLSGPGQGLGAHQAGVQLAHVRRPARRRHLGQHGSGPLGLILPREIERGGVTQAVVLRPGRQPAQQ